MKPILIFVKESNGIIQMTKKALESIVDQAYEAGRQDFTTRPITYPYTWGTTDIPLQKIDITCERSET